MIDKYKEEVQALHKRITGYEATIKIYIDSIAEGQKRIDEHLAKIDECGERILDLNYLIEIREARKQ